MKCPYCGKNFKNKTVYDAHIEGHEYEIDKEIMEEEEEEEEKEEEEEEV